jgi:hypothetical protein
VSGVAADSSIEDRQTVSAQTTDWSALATVTNETNATQHENPDNTTGSGDLGQVQSHLAGQLSSTLADRTISLTRGEYEAANESLGEFDSQLSKYVDVAGETDRNSGGDNQNDDGGSAGNDQGQEFEEAREQQREFGEELRTYRETRQAYEQAIENGNTTRARRLARQLVRQAENVTESGRQVDTALENLSAVSGSDTDQLRAAEEAVEQTINTATETRREIINQEFTETQIQAQLDSDRVSFANPAQVTGQLTTPNGTALSNRTVAIDIGQQPVTVTTDNNGQFIPYGQ